MKRTTESEYELKFIDQPTRISCSRRETITDKQARESPNMGWIERKLLNSQSPNIIFRLLSEMDGRKGFICMWLMKTNLCIAMFHVREGTVSIWYSNFGLSSSCDVRCEQEKRKCSYGNARLLRNLIGLVLFRTLDPLRSSFHSVPYHVKFGLRNNHFSHYPCALFILLLFVVDAKIGCSLNPFINWSSFPLIAYYHNVEIIPWYALSRHQKNQITSKINYLT